MAIREYLLLIYVGGKLGSATAKNTTYYVLTACAQNHNFLKKTYK